MVVEVEVVDRSAAVGDIILVDADQVGLEEDVLEEAVGVEVGLEVVIKIQIRPPLSRNPAITKF